MKNFKPQTKAPKGALCACGDRLGPHFYAEGGSVDPRSRSQAERAAAANPLAALAGLWDIGAGALRGSARATLGLPGDLVELADMLGLELGRLGKKAGLPTSESLDKTLPALGGLVVPPESNPYQELGEFTAVPGTSAAVRGASKATKAVGRGALGALSTAARNAAAPSERMAMQGQRGAIRLRGGNFDLGAPETWSGDWIPENLDRENPIYKWQNSVLRNYIRKDLGAPTDPLLALEKELPGLHFGTDEAWPVGEDEVAHLYNNARIAGRPIEDNVPLPPRFSREPHLTPNPPDAYRGTKRYLDRHVELSGGAPLTRWGRAADSNVITSTAKADLAEQLANEWPMSGLYPERLYPDDKDPLGALLRHTDEAIERLSRPAEFGGRPGPTNETRLEKVKAYRAKIDDALKTDWRAKTPDAETFRLFPSAGDDLGFNHIVDYLEAATEPYRSLRKWVDTHSDATLHGSDIGEYLREIQREGGAAMLPRGSDEMRRWKELMDAGLTLDPASLQRLSVQDAVRKTAKWNEFLANKATADGPLSKGWKEFKAYPDDPKGMRWVEFGAPEKTAFTEETLPAGFKIFEPRPGRFSVVWPDTGEFIDTAPSKAEALADFSSRYARRPIEEGLKAEGDAMGHCVGGYCDDVIQRGTKIYSLRDAKGRPHVTIETRPAHQEMPTTDYGWAREYGDDLLKIDEYARGPDSDPELPFEANRRRAAKLLFPERFAAAPPSEIVQIKGKGNAAPVDEYLPYVQDFVRSGKWGRVGDLRNTGLRQLKDVFGPEELRRLSSEGLIKNALEEMDRYVTLDEVLQMTKPEDHSVYQSAFEVARRRGYAEGGVVEKDPEGFLPRDFDGWFDYLEQQHAHSA